MSKQEKVLSRLIDQLVSVTDGERNLYPYLRDLLSHKNLGIGLAADQLVIDSTLGGKSGIPDVAVYSTRNGKAIKGPDHLAAVFEVKVANGLKNESAVFAEKQKYVQAGTRWFFMLDQQVVSRRYVEHSLDEPPVFFDWEDLRNPAEFSKCFGVISRNALRLEDELERFVDGKTRFAYRDIDAFGRRQFIATIRVVSQRLHAAVDGVVQTRIRQDLTSANAMVAKMEDSWGERRVDPDWSFKDGHPIEFARVVDDSLSKLMTQADLEAYQEDHDRFSIEIEPLLYALEIEYATLPRYAARLGVELASLESDSKDSKTAVESFIYETASLILSRMLMIRFSEDHGFMVRHISNGGVTTFTQYAKHFKQPFQTLLRQTYDHAREMYRGLFDKGVLDWVLTGNEEEVSDALLHAMYLLSRWDFRTVHGDILSGVYDHYLETSKRRELGEVFTRPEIARYLLEKCGYEAGKGQLVLDPACGTGTFIVEALEAELTRLRAAGLLSIDTVRTLLPKLCGMDINPFSVSLAQIQMLWHLMDLFTSANKKQASEVATTLLPLLNIQGGRSSLDAMGVPMTEGTHQKDLGFDIQRSNERRRATTRIPARFRKVNAASYDIVAGNPPYVRAHRRTTSSLMDDYGEVATGQFDLYLLFIYRALRTWVKVGGRMGFIVPIALLDAGYAGALRKVLRAYKIIEIVDLELLRRKTFHGVKRPTIILIVENSPGADDDDVTLTTVPPSAYEPVDDHVNMGASTSVVLKRRTLFQETYLPGVTAHPWTSLVDYDAGDQSPWTSKILPADLDALQSIAQARRLGSIVRTAYRKKKGKDRRVARTIPVGEHAHEWEQVMLISTGLKLGGKAAMCEDGPPIYKGQNLFPGGLIGEPMGRWKRGAESTPYLYSYENFFDADRMYAFREIAQLPVACPVPEGVVFQNTVLLVQLDTPFALDAWCMSRVIQFYMAKVMRSTVIEDLGAHWYKRQIAFMPIPTTIDDKLNQALAAAAAKVIHADRDLADEFRHIDALVTSNGITLLDAFLKDDARCAGLVLMGLPEEPVSLAGVREDGDAIVADDILFKAVVPDPNLRSYLLFSLERKLLENPDAALSRADFAKTLIPADLTAATQEVQRLKQHDARGAFNQALDDLDTVAGAALGLSAAQSTYIRAEMHNDPYLKQLSILWEHRGPRVQAYSDSAGVDRYG